MIIDKSRGLIFIHIPKNAGRSIGTSLLGGSHYPGKHDVLPDRDLLGPMPKIAVIRNPYDRIISIYEYQKMMASKSIGLNIHTQRRFIKNNPGFLEYLRYLKANQDKFMETHSRPQEFWLKCKSGKPIRNLNLLRFEELQSDIDKFFKSINKTSIILDKINASKREDYSKYYENPEARKIVNELYRSDFDIYNRINNKEVI